MSRGYYILVGHEAVPATSDQWGSWFEKAREERRVARTELADGIVVSTVFLGSDHQWGNGPPHIFETMTFGGPNDEDCERCSTWVQAEAQHAQAVRAAQAWIDNHIASKPE